MSEWQPSVAVVVPAYNAVDSIDDCIGSLLELRYPLDLLELRVVDNGSNDGTVAALRRYGDRIVVMRELRRGPAAARNAGLRSTSADVVAFTDADCVVEPEWLGALVATLADPQVGVAGGTIRAQFPATEIELFGDAIHNHQQAIEVFWPPYAITMSWASRRSVMRALGGFDERFRRAEDVDLSYRLIQAGHTLTFVPESVVYHRNEDRLSGLFREGFAHGFYGVQARKRHEGFLGQLGHPRVNAQAYAEIGAGLLRWGRRADDVRSRCNTVFNAGKKAGKLAGSVRFGHIDL